MHSFTHLSLPYVHPAGLPYIQPALHYRPTDIHTYIQSDSVSVPDMLKVADMHAFSSLNRFQSSSVCPVSNAASCA